MISVQLPHFVPFFEEMIQTIQTELEAEENFSEHQLFYLVGETVRVFICK